MKIGDFGIAKSTLTELTVLQTTVGTLGYQAPEILGFVAARNAHHYDEKCDIWSFGCVLFEICTGSMLFRSLHDLQSFCQSEKFRNFPIDLEAMLFKYLHSLLQCSPTDRPNAEEALRLGEEWFQSVTSSDVADQQEPTQQSMTMQLKAGKASFRPRTSTESVESVDSAYQTVVSTMESPASLHRQRNVYFGPEIADVICVLHPRSPMALNAVQATMLAAPDCILQNDDLDNVTGNTLAEYLEIGSRKRAIVLRLSLSVKAPGDGFRFGRHPPTCDVVLTENVHNELVGDIHFKIFINQRGRLLIEDCSTHGTYLDDEEVESKDKGVSGAKPVRRLLRNGTRRVLRDGAIINVVVGPGARRERIKFMVRIPDRKQYQNIYETRVVPR